MAKAPEPALEDDGEGHPRTTAHLVGHAEAERTLLDAYRSGRIPHAWLIGGVAGIGKATLAYRMARFVLAHPDPAMPQVQRAETLDVAPDHPVFRRIASRSHSDLLALERTLNDKGKLRQTIAVDDVRRTVGFFGSTAGEGGWRVAIVDSVDDLNRESANALLKVLEEPPRRALMLLVSHAAGRVLPTIRSRCRMLALRPLSVDEVAAAASAVSGLDADAPQLRAAAEAADGSVMRALSLMDGPALELRRLLAEQLAALPSVDPRALHRLSDKLPINDVDALAAFMDGVDDWLSGRIAPGASLHAMNRIAEVYEQVNRAGRDAEAFNLDRKPLVFQVFGLLAEAARG